jgi:hypothetical protein
MGAMEKASSAAKSPTTKIPRARDSPRERAKLLDLQREQTPLPPEVKAILEWVDQVLIFTISGRCGGRRMIWRVVAKSIRR